MLSLCLHFQIYSHSIFGMLTENGTCTSGDIAIGNKTSVENQSYADLIKNLTEHNRPLAEVMCENLLNLRIPR